MPRPPLSNAAIDRDIAFADSQEIIFTVIQGRDFKCVSNLNPATQNVRLDIQSQQYDSWIYTPNSFKNVS